MVRDQPHLCLAAIYNPRTFSEQLTEKLQLIYVDTRGFAPDAPGQAEQDVILDAIIGDLEDVRLQLGLEQVMLVGHSIHAFIALEYAKCFPKNVSKLVLIGSAPIAGPD